MTSQTIAVPPQRNDWDPRGLPAWTYHSQAMLERETRELFLKHWQIAAHVSNVPKPGDFITLDIAAERVIIMRGAARQRCRQHGALCRRSWRLSHGRPRAGRRDH